MDIAVGIPVDHEGSVIVRVVVGDSVKHITGGTGYGLIGIFPADHIGTVMPDHIPGHSAKGIIGIAPGSPVGTDGGGTVVLIIRSVKPRGQKTYPLDPLRLRFRTLPKEESRPLSCVCYVL